MGFVRLAPQLTKAEPVHDYVVRVPYADGLIAEVDLDCLVGKGPVFEPLGDPAYFRRLRASHAAANTITWPSGADIARRRRPSMRRRKGFFKPFALDLQKDSFRSKQLATGTGTPGG